ICWTCRRSESRFQKPLAPWGRVVGGEEKDARDIKDPRPKGAILSLGSFPSLSSFPSPPTTLPQGARRASRTTWKLYPRQFSRFTIAGRRPLAGFEGVIMDRSAAASGSWREHFREVATRLAQPTEVLRQLLGDIAGKAVDAVGAAGGSIL